MCEDLVQCWWLHWLLAVEHVVMVITICTAMKALVVPSVHKTPMALAKSLRTPVVMLRILTWVTMLAHVLCILNTTC